MPEVPLITRPMQSDIATRNPNDVYATLGQTLGASFSDMMVHNPVSALFRASTIDSMAAETDGVTGIGQDIENVTPEFLEEHTDNWNWLNRDQVLEEMKLNQLNQGDLPVGAYGANRNVVQHIIQQKVAERKRSEMIARGAEGRTGRILLTGLAASFIDPINVASSFLPFGAARSATKMSRLVQAGKNTAGRRFLIRANQGIKEGFLGSLLIEPLSLYAANKDQLNYDVSDALASIAYGTVLGGGLHSFGGVAGDLLGRTHITQTYDSLPLNVRIEAADSALLAATIDRRVMADQFIAMTHGPLSHGKNKRLVETLIEAFESEKNGVVPSRNIRREIEKITGTKIEAQDLTVTDIVEKIKESSGMTNDVLDLVAKSTDVEDFMGRVRELKADHTRIEDEMMKDAAIVLGVGASKREVKKLVKTILKQMDDGDTSLGNFSGNAGQKLDTFNAKFFAPENLNSFVPGRAEELKAMDLPEVDEPVTKDQSPFEPRRATDSETAKFQTEVEDIEATIAKFEEETQTKTGYSDEVARIDAEIDTEVELKTSVADCVLKELA